MELINVQNLEVSIGKKLVLKGIDLDIEKGSVTAFVGPSGSGKTTLLRTLNLIQKPQKGQLKIADKTVNVEKMTKKDIQEIRNYSTMVFQQFNLFKNYTAFENVWKPLVLSGRFTKTEAETLATEALEKVGLSNFANQYPVTLSGGQQQRVAIARAIAFKPEVILFDEPTSSLDPEMVDSVLQVIEALAKEDITMVLVTHEMDFARRIASKVVFIENGEILVQGPADLLLSPNSSHDRVRSFVNSLYRGSMESASL